MLPKYSRILSTNYSLIRNAPKFCDYSEICWSTSVRKTVNFMRNSNSCEISLKNHQPVSRIFAKLMRLERCKIIHIFEKRRIADIGAMQEYAWMENESKNAASKKQRKADCFASAAAFSFALSSFNLSAFSTASLYFSQNLALIFNHCVVTSNWAVFVMFWDIRDPANFRGTSNTILLDPSISQSELTNRECHNRS